MTTHKLTGMRLGVALLTCLAESPDGVPFNRLSEELNNTPAPTLSRTLKVLTEEGWVCKDDRRYRLGPEFQAAARRAVGAVNLGELLQPIVEGLAAATGESAAFAEFLGPHFTFTARCHRPDSFHYMACGLPNPKITANPFCVTILAYQPGSTVQHSVKIAPPDGTASAFKALLKGIREEGCFFTDLPFNNRFIAPVFAGPGGRVVGSIGISRTAPRGTESDIQTLMAAVRDAAANATALTGRSRA